MSTRELIETVITLVWEDSDAARKVRNFRDNVSEMIDTTDNMARTSKIALAAVGTGFTVAGTKAKQFGKAMQDVGSQILQTQMALVAQGETFEVEMAKMAVTVDGNREVMDAFRKKAIQTGIDTAFSPQEAISALTSLRQQGLSLNQTLNTLDPTLSLVAASMGRVGLAEGARVAAGAFNVLGVEADEMGDFMDELLFLTQNSTVQFEDLERAIFGLGDAPKQLAGTTRQSFLTMIAASKAFTGSVAQGGQDIQAFARGFQTLQQEALGLTRSQRKTKALGILGITLDDLVEVVDGVAQYRDALEVIDLIHERGALTGLNQVEQLAALGRVFQQTGGRAVQAVLKMRALEEELKGVEGATEGGVKTALAFAEGLTKFGLGGDKAAAAAKQFLNTFAGAKKLLEGSIQTFSIILVDDIIPALTFVTRATVDFVNVMLRLFKQSRALRIATMALVFSLGAATVMTGTLIVAVGTLMMFVGGAILVFAAFAAVLASAEAIAAALTVVLGALSGAIVPILLALGLMAPFAIMAASAMFLLTAAAAAFGVGIAANLAGSRDVLVDLFGDIANAAEALFQILAFGEVEYDVGHRLMRESPEILKKFVLFIGGLVFRLRRMVKGMVEGFKPVLAIVFPVLETMLKLFGALAGVMSDLINQAFFPGKILGPSDLWVAAGKVIGGTIGLIAAAFLLLGAVVSMAMLSVIAVPVVVIAALVKLFRWLWGRAETMAAFGGVLLGGLLDGLKIGWQLIKDWFSNAMNELIDMIPFKEELEAMASAGQSLVSGAANQVAQGAQGLMGRAGAAVGQGLAPVGQRAAVGTQAAGDTINNAREVAVNVGEMSLSVANATPEEAERTAQMILDRVAEEIERQTGMGFGG